MLVLLFAQGLTLFVSGERAAYDWQFQHRGSRPAPADIEIVRFDLASLKALDHFTYPARRLRMAQAIDRLRHAGAKVIGLDFEYLAPSRYGGAEDIALATAMKRAGNVVIGQDLNTSSASNFIANETQLQVPLPILARAAAGLGVVNVPLDGDGVVRSGWMQQVGPQHQLYPSLALQIAALALGRSPAAIARGFPFSVLVNYPAAAPLADASPSGWNTLSFLSVLRGTFDPAAVRNKIVLVVPHAPPFGDTHRTPYGQMYGGYVQASNVETIVHHDPMVPAGNMTDSLILLVLGLLATLVSSRFGILQSVAAAFVILVGFPLVALYVFSTFNVWLHLITPEATAVIAFAAIMAFRFATEERLKRRAHRLFGQYVKPEVVEILVNATDDETALRGGRRPVSVLFVDIRGFTAMSEHMQPEDVVRALDTYLEDLTRSIDSLDGTLNKYVGSEIVAMWNAPRRQDDHAMLAVRCALDMLARAEHINAELDARGLPQISYGLGVNTGDAVVGSMGSTLRKQYDLIGDAVNTGARLCSAAGGGETIIGQHTWELIGDQLELEETEPLRLKGKSEPLRTFKVLGMRTSVAPTILVASAHA